MLFRVVIELQSKKDIHFDIECTDTCEPLSESFQLFRTSQSRAQVWTRYSVRLAVVNQACQADT